MEKMSKIVYSVISLVVIVLLIATTVIPVINDASTEQHSVAQNVNARYTTVVGPETDVEIGISSSQPTINGVYIGNIIDLTQYTETTVFWVMSDSISARAIYFAGAGNWQTWKIMYYDESTTTAYDASLASSGTVKWSNGTVTVTNSDVTYTHSYSYLMVPSDSGNYGLWISQDMPRFVDDKSTVYAAYFGALGTYWFGHGKISAFNTDLVIDNYTLISDSTKTIVSSKTAYDASNELTSITVSYSSTNRAASYFFMPIDYTVISANQNAISMLLQIIPLMLIVVPIMIAASLVTTRRD